MHRDVWGESAYDAAYGAGAPRPTGDRTRALGFASIAIGVLFVLFGIAPTAANATQPNPEHKVTLCHRTDSYTNPYVRITVDVASVLHNGHDSHDGPVFFPAIPKHTKWGDIIPPFDFGPGETYAGKNWTSAGIAIFDDGCNLAANPSTTTTTSPSTTTVPAPTTSTIPVASSTSSSSTPTTTGEPGGSTTTTSSSVPETTSSSAAVTTSTAGTVTTEGATTTAPGVTSTTISNTVVALASSSTTVEPGHNTSLPFTGGSSAAAIVAGLVLVAAGLGLTRRTRLHH